MAMLGFPMVEPKDPIFCEAWCFISQGTQDLLRSAPWEFNPSFPHSFPDPADEGACQSLDIQPLNGAQSRVGGERLHRLFQARQAPGSLPAYRSVPCPHEEFVAVLRANTQGLREGQGRLAARPALAKLQQRHLAF